MAIAAAAAVYAGRTVLAGSLTNGLGLPDSAHTPVALSEAELTAWVTETHDEWNGDIDPRLLAARRFGPSVANRNRNPLNMKYGSDTRRYVDAGSAIISAIVPLDGGRFLKFDSAVEGFRAAAALLTAPRFIELELDRALRRWSNNGYGAEILAAAGLDASSAVLGLGRDELSLVLRAMARAEGYRSDGVVDEIREALDFKP